MKKYILKILLILTFLLIIVFFEGCGTTNVNVMVTHPAEMNMLNYKKLIVNEFSGLRGNSVNNELINSLMESNRFELIDHNYLSKLLYENGLNYENVLSNGMNEQVGHKVGKIALISGKILKHDFKEEVKKGTAEKDNKNINHYTYTRFAHVYVSINFQITDLNSGKIIFSKNIERNLDDSRNQVDREPENFKKDYMLEQTRKLVIQDFLKKIIPYSETVTVELYDDSDVPDYEKGIKYAKNGFWEKAIPAFLDGINFAKNNELKAKGYYNLGIAYQYSYLFNDALNSFDKAFSIDGKDKYMSAMKNCKQMEAEYNLVREQMKQ